MQAANISVQYRSLVTLLNPVVVMVVASLMLETTTQPDSQIRKISLLSGAFAKANVSFSRFWTSADS